ncbi:tyrosine-type recombinase/integrase [Kocuria coralli]|nr:tyrosine-type recombinase/integrase [Kocuria coralli]
MLSVPIPRPTPRPTPIQTLLAALKRARDDRDRLMLLLASYAGLRRTEIAQVHADHIENGFLTVQGKGGQQRIVPIHPVLASLLEMIKRRGGWAFPGRFTGHCHPDFIGRRLSRLLGPGWTGHTLRHFFASHTYWNSRDLRSVQELLGHASIATTQIYVGADRQALINVVGSLPTLDVKDLSNAS